ncbi:MAG: TetR/AcrR family transcriptional regulator [Thermoleophilia bacterium]|nr:TetR/AcrR family transcriptional regulator [Thermoleophilia bacterium]
MSTRTASNAESSRRGRPARLSREQIIQTALGLADAEGLEAFSMRRLARELDVSPMALYGYFEAKNDLVRAMLDVVSQGLGPVEPGDREWPDHLADMGWRMRANILEHPRLAQLFVTAPALGGRAMHVVEEMIGALRSQGVPAETAVRAVYAVTAYAIGFVAQEVPRRERGDTASRRSALQSLPEDRFPNMVELAEVAAGYSSDEQFESGLHSLIDGYRRQAGAE